GLEPLLSRPLDRVHGSVPPALAADDAPTRVVARLARLRGVPARALVDWSRSRADATRRRGRDRPIAGTAGRYRCAAARVPGPSHPAGVDGGRRDGHQGAAGPGEPGGLRWHDRGNSTLEGAGEEGGAAPGAAGGAWAKRRRPVPEPADRARLPGSPCRGARGDARGPRDPGPRSVSPVRWPPPDPCDWRARTGERPGARIWPPCSKRAAPSPFGGSRTDPSRRRRPRRSEPTSRR